MFTFIAIKFLNFIFYYLSNWIIFSTFAVA